jgi:glycosyltransferase involved in cell wall biosynthesis
MKRVGISCHSLYRLKRDGIGIYSEELLQALQQLNHVEPAAHKINFRIKMMSYFKIVASCREPFDLLHVTDYIVPKYKGIPIIATLHDAIPLQFSNWVNPRFRRVKNHFLRSIIRPANHIIALSHAIVPDLVSHWGVSYNKISIVYPGVSRKWFITIGDKTKKRVLQKYEIDRKYMLFVGTLQPRKNICRMLQAYEDLPNRIKEEYSFILIGQAGWCNDEIFTHINKLTRQRHGKWLNYVPSCDIHALFQSAEFFIFPSLYEGFGLPILEAFASGLPVITSNISSMLEISGDASLMVDPYSVEAISEAMRQLCENESLKQDLARKGLERAQDFSWERCAQQTQDVYRQFIEL